MYGNELWSAVSRRGAGGRGAEAGQWPQVVGGRFFCLVADWSQPYVILEAARTRGKEELTAHRQRTYQGLHCIDHGHQ